MHYYNNKLLQHLVSIAKSQTLYSAANLLIIRQPNLILIYNVKALDAYFLRNRMPCELNRGIQDEHLQLIGNMTTLHHPEQTTWTANLPGREINYKYTMSKTYSTAKTSGRHPQYAINTHTYLKHN